jgi:hypothetical protein
MLLCQQMSAFLWIFTLNKLDFPKISDSDKILICMLQNEILDYEGISNTVAIL